MRKILSMFAVLLMVLGVVGSPALAQDEVTAFCGDLSAEDCDLLTGASEAMADVTEGTFDLNMAFEATGGEAIPPVSLNLAGAYSQDAETIASLSNNDMMIEEMSVEQTLDLVDDVLSAFNADVTLTVTLPAELTAGLGLPPEISFGSRYVDGSGYINLDDLSDLTGGAFTGWHGMNVGQAVQGVVALAGGPEALQQQLDQAGAGTGVSPEQFDQVNTLLEGDPGQFLMVQRLDDSTIDGTNVAVFETQVDIAAIVANEDFQALLQESAQAQAEASGVEIPQEELDAITQEQLALFEGAAPLVVTQAIGLDDNFNYDTSINWDFEVPAEMSGTEEPTMLMIDFSLGYNDFNNAPLIETPADATLHTVMELMGALGGGGAPVAPADG